MSKNHDRHNWHKWQQRWKKRRRLLAVDPRCAYCDRRLTIKTSTIDHVTPLDLGGVDDESNVVLACKSCNVAKDNLLPLNFFMSRHHIV
jgi:5-methylcytosine-specific restriction endonuclease McrA